MGSRLSAAIAERREIIGFVGARERPGCCNCKHAGVKPYYVAKGAGKQLYCKEYSLFVSSFSVCLHHEREKK